MTITIPAEYIEYFLSFQWLSWKPILALSLIYGLINHYKSLYYVNNKWNQLDIPQAIEKFRLKYPNTDYSYNKLQKLFARFDKWEMLSACLLYLCLAFPVRIGYASLRTIYNLALKPSLFIFGSIFLLQPLSLPKFKSFRSYVALNGDDDLPHAYAFIRTTAI